MIPPWNERPTEIANLLNPAFVGVLLRKAVDGYTEEANAGMPLELLFLVPPFCLHPTTASRLPARAASTPLHAWLQRDENRDVLLTFADRASALVPFVREALLFATERGVVAVGDDGWLRAGANALRGITAYRASGEEVKEAIRLAEFVGRWFALAGTTATVFTLLGVRP
jgi:Family of unknown function (DUF6521)